MKKVLILLALLIVPSALYIAFTTGKHKFLNLPYYGPKIPYDTLDKRGNKIVDTLYHEIPFFEFTNQDGKPFGSANLDGKIYIANFFFTTCPGICLKTSTQLVDLQRKIKGDHRIQPGEVQLVAFTVKPEEDSVPVLKAYAQRLQADSTIWNLLTGDREEIYDLGQKGYLINANVDVKAPGGIFHSGDFLLIDRENRIRGIYDGTSSAEVKKLMEDVRTLIANYQTPRDGKTFNPKVEQKR